MDEEPSDDFPFPTIGQALVHPVMTTQVSWGHNPDTLEPQVLLAIRPEEDPQDQITFAIAPSLCIGLIGELQWAVDRCRANHVDPESVKFDPETWPEGKPLPWESPGEE